MPTRAFPGTYGIELLWWHSVTNCFGDPHGVQTYGYIDKWEYFPVVFERNCQNRSVTPKTINSNGYKNLLRYIRNIAIMVAFRNKWFWGPPWGLSIRMSYELGRFPVVYGNSFQTQSVTPKTFGSYAHKNIARYIRNRTIMVAFRNKLFRRHSRGANVMDISTNGKIFLWCSSATAKIEVLHQKLLTRMGKRIC